MRFSAETHLSFKYLRLFTNSLLGLLTYISAQETAEEIFADNPINQLYTGHSVSRDKFTFHSRNKH